MSFIYKSLLRSFFSRLFIDWWRNIFTEVFNLFQRYLNCFLLLFFSYIYVYINLLWIIFCSVLFRFCCNFCFFNSGNVIYIFFCKFRFFNRVLFINSRLNRNSLLYKINEWIIKQLLICSSFIWTFFITIFFFSFWQ